MRRRGGRLTISIIIPPALSRSPSLPFPLFFATASFGSTIANSSLGYSQSFSPAEMGNISPHHVSGNMSPQNLNLSGSMSPHSQANDNSYASVNGGNGPPNPIFAPPQNHQQVMGGGGVCPVALITMLVLGSIIIQVWCGFEGVASRAGK